MNLAIESLATLPSLTLMDLDNTWTTTRRYDTKFIVTKSFIEQFLNETSSSFAALEVGGARSFTYRTTYFDTEDLLLYRDHAQRRRRRIKIRTRQYVESKRSRLEVKAKLGNGQTQKAFFENHDILGEAEIPLVNQALTQLNKSSRYFGIEEQLIQATVTNFQRSTAINRNSVERITFDSSLILEANNTRIQLSPELLLVEIKSPHRISDTVRDLRRRGIHPTAFSKYCAAIESTQTSRPRVHSANNLERILTSVN